MATETKTKRTTKLDQLGDEIGDSKGGAAEAASTQGLRVTITVENLGDDREDPPAAQAPEPTTVVRPIRGPEDEVAQLVLPKVRLSGGKAPRMIFAITLED